MEGLEDLGQTVRRDADAGSRHRDHHEIAALVMDAEHHASLGGRELDGVVEQLTERPGDLLRISLHRRDILVHHRMDAHAAVASFLLHRFDGQVGETFEIERFLFQAQLAARGQ